MTHCDELTLWGFLQGERNETIALHLAGCEQCSERVASLRGLDDAFRRNRFWESYRAGEGTRGEAPVAAVESLASRLREEEIDARREINDIVATPSSILTRRATAGLVTALVEAIRRYIDLDPDKVLWMSRAAVTIADSLSREYPEQLRLNLRVRARKEHANGLRLVGRFPESLAVLDAAETLTDDLVVNEPALASLSYVRATVLRDMGRFDDAYQEARSVAALFERFGDSERALHARLLVAAILFRRGMVAAAREEWTSLLRLATGDVTRARLIQNIGCALQEERNFDGALARFHEATEIFARLQKPIDTARVEWNIGRLHLAKGSLTSALAQFHLARRFFLDRNMHDEASLIALDIAETWVLLGRHGDATEVLGPLVGWFTAAGAHAWAQQALGLLREALAEGRLTTEQITVLRNAMRHLQDEGKRIALQPSP